MVPRLAPIAADDGWRIKKARVDRALFSEGQIGPYSLGPTLRRTAFGEVIVAVHPHLTDVVELDLFDALCDTPLTSPSPTAQGDLMGDLALAMELDHEHVARMIGSGFADGVPYVVRTHRLGRTLGDLCAGLESSRTELSRQAAAGIAYSVCQACAFLAEQGTHRGALSVGGFGLGEVYLAFDGAILLEGIGLSRARPGGADPLAADRASCFELVRCLDDLSRAQLSSAAAGAAEPGEIARALRRRSPEACASRSLHVASALREQFSDAIHEERTRFGLSSMH